MSREVGYIVSDLSLPQAPKLPTFDIPDEVYYIIYILEQCIHQKLLFYHI